MPGSPPNRLCWNLAKARGRVSGSMMQTAAPGSVSPHMLRNGRLKKGRGEVVVVEDTVRKYA